MSAAVASPQVIVFEETFSTKEVTPKVKALQERLANAQLQKDATNLKDKLDQRMAKAAALVEKVIPNRPS